MPYTTATAPRPILKSSSRKSSTSSCDSDCLPSSSPKHTCVQFSPCLSTTYLTHGSKDYDRCPISVTPKSDLLVPKRCRNDSVAALAQFRMEAEGRALLPPVMADDGYPSSSEESDSSLPPSPTYDPAPSAYTIPPSLLKSTSSRNPYVRRSPKKSASYPPSIPRSSSHQFEYDGRDDIFGGF